jgi:hypothetical protein
MFLGLKVYGEFDGHDRPSGYNAWVYTRILTERSASATDAITAAHHQSRDSLVRQLIRKATSGFRRTSSWQVSKPATTLKSPGRCRGFGFIRLEDVCVL